MSKQVHWPVPEYFRCGHPKSPENILTYAAGSRCRTCSRKSNAQYRKNLPAARKYEQMRRKRMAEMIEKTRRKLVGLYAEAKRYGMTHLLENPDEPS